MKISLTPQPGPGAARTGPASDSPIAPAMKPLHLMGAEQINTKRLLESLEILSVREFNLHDLFDVTPPGQINVESENDASFRFILQ